MIRPEPTKELILELTGGNHTLVTAAHHGLVETPLGGLYSNLDLDETIAFEASSWKFRQGKPIIKQKDPNIFATFVESASIYEIFNKVCKSASVYLTEHEEIPEHLKELHEILNPFKGEKLEQRLERVDVEDVKRLKERLQEPVKRHVFQKQYPYSISINGVKDDIYIIPLPYPKKGRGVVEQFADLVTRMISGYPTEYEPLNNVKVSSSI